MQKILFTTILTIIMFFGLTGTVHAAIIDQTINRTLNFKGTHVNVREVLNTKVNDANYFIPAGSEVTFRVFNPILNDEAATEKINKTLPTIKVKDANGQDVPFRTEIEGQDIIVKTIFQSAVRQSNNKIILTYRSFALTSQTGAVYDLYIPSFKKDFEFDTESNSLNVNTKVVIPKSYGDLNFISPDKEPNPNKNNWVINFTREDLTGVISWIQIGTTQYYQFEIRQPYTDSSELGIFTNNYQVLLPRNVSAGALSQKVFFEKIEPSPKATRTDELGNLVADFELPANSSGEIVITGYIEINDKKDVDITNSGNIGDIPAEILSANTQSAQYWESNSAEIAGVARELKGDKQNVYEIMQHTYDYVVDLIDYSEVKRFGINERQGALKTLQGGAAVCMEYSDLFIALMRAQGVPARAAFGYGYDSRSTDGIDTAHQWAEVYIPSIQEWIMVDTTWGESGSTVVGSDLNHFYKYVASESPLEPSPVSVKFFGELREISEESFTITALAQAPDGEYFDQTKLLSTYPDNKSDNAVSAGIESIFASLSDLNTRIDNTLLVDFDVEDPQLRQILRFVIYATPVLFIILLISFIRMLRVRPKEDMIEAHGR